MQYECDRELDQDSPDGEPSLADMTEAAIKMLQKNDQGFFLMVEGGKIDKSHHSGKVILPHFASFCVNLRHFASFCVIFAQTNSRWQSKRFSPCGNPKRDLFPPESDAILRTYFGNGYTRNPSHHI
jgi:hypothetical protein